MSRVPFTRSIVSTETARCARDGPWVVWHAYLAVYARPGAANEEMI